MTGLEGMKRSRKINICWYQDCQSSQIFKLKGLGWGCLACHRTFQEPEIRLTKLDKNKRRKPEDISEHYDASVPPPEVLLQFIKEIPKTQLKWKALLATLYLLGARIGEICKQNKTNFYQVGPLKKYQFSFEEYNGEDFLIVYNVPCFKVHKFKKKRKIPERRSIPINIKQEEPFVYYIKKYLKQLKNSTDKVFNITPSYACRICKKYTKTNNHKGFFPHYFRHMRLTHLAQKYGFNSHELRQFTGWVTETTAKEYVNLHWHDIANKMRRN